MKTRITLGTILSSRNFATQQAAIAGFEVGSRGVWQRPAPTFLDDIVMSRRRSKKGSEARQEQQRSEAPRQQGRKLVRVTVLEVKQGINIKPRKRASQEGTSSKLRRGSDANRRSNKRRRMGRVARTTGK